MHKIPGDHNKKETKVEIGGRSPFAVSDDTAVSDILEVCRASLSRLILIKPVSSGWICNNHMLCSK